MIYGIAGARVNRMRLSATSLVASSSSRARRSCATSVCCIRLTSKITTYICPFLSVLVFHQVEPVIAQRIYNHIVGENQHTDIPPWANLSLILHWVFKLTDGKGNSTKLHVCTIIKACVNVNKINPNPSGTTVLVPSSVYRLVHWFAKYFL